MNFLGKLFTWWDGATIGTAIMSAMKGKSVGQDALGNRYYTDAAGARRWVIYAGANDASRVPPEWHGWLHHQVEGVPDEALPPQRSFEKAPLPNLTGTGGAYRPAGALERGATRARATGDYEAWSPDQA